MADPTYAEIFPAMRQRGIQEVGSALGWPVKSDSSGHHCACVVCREPTRHRKSKDRRGAIGAGLQAPGGWRCHQCGASGDVIDFVAHVLRGARYRDLDRAGRHAALAWCAEWLGLAAPRPPRSVDAAPRAALPRPKGQAAPEPLPPAPPKPMLSPEQCQRIRSGMHVAAGVHQLRATHDYLRARGIDPRAVHDRGLAVALRRNADPASLAMCGAGRMHAQGYRLVMPLHDADGQPRNYIARTLRNDARIKSRSPAGYRRSGLVLADGMALDMLRRSAEAGEVRRVVICEGEGDWLLTASRAPEGWAVLGVISGSWGPAYAERIPPGVDVVIATDDDDAGDKYAAPIVASLAGRDVRIRRWRPQARRAAA